MGGSGTGYILGWGTGKVLGSTGKEGTSRFAFYCIEV